MEDNEKPDEIPLTVMISTEKKTLGVVSIFDNVAAIKAIKVEKANLSTIPDSWKAGCGFYILVSNISEGHFHAYVGKATQNNFYSRLSSHRRDKANWDYAFLFQRDTSSGLNSTQASYVEGEIYKLLRSADDVAMLNGTAAGDKTLADHEVFYMNQVVKSALRIMDIFGYKFVKADPAEKKQSSKYYGVSVKQLVKVGMLVPGEKVVSVIDKYPAETILGSTGIIVNGKEAAPTPAVKSTFEVLYPERNGPNNGWTFWGVIRNEVPMSLADLREEYVAQRKLYEASLITEKTVDPDEAISSNENNKLATSHKDPERHADARTKIYELVDAGLLEDGMVVISLDPDNQVDASIENSSVRFNGNSYPDPSIAAKYALRIKDPEAGKRNGWRFWGVETDDGEIIELNEVLDSFLAE